MLDLITMKRKCTTIKCSKKTRSNFITQINGKDMVSSCNWMNRQSATKIGNSSATDKKN